MTSVAYGWVALQQQNRSGICRTVRTLCLAGGLLLSLLSYGPAYGLDHKAEKTGPITPSDVFQITQQTINILVPILKARHVTKQPDTFYFKNRQPRHAWQKAREALVKMQALQVKEGLSPVTLPPLYVKDVEPADVIKLATLLHSSVQNLASHYEITANITDVPLRQGKSPSDVYRNFTQIRSMLDSLLNTKVVPSDVYQVARSINDILRQVYHKIEHPVPAFTPPKVVGKRPRDVYMLAHEVHTDLKSIHDSTYLPVRGGIPVLPRKGGLITPQNVINVAGAVLADVHAIGSVRGLTDIVELAAYEPGKTPSDVYAEFLKAQVLVRGLK